MAEELIVTSANFRVGLYAVYALVIVLAIATLVSWTPWVRLLISFLERLQASNRRLGVISLLGFAVLLAAFPFIVLGFYGRFLTAIFPRLFLFWSLVAIGTLLLAAWRKSDWLTSLPASLVIFASVYVAATFFYLVTDFPFSLEWSEISRYYQASFFFSQQVYGVSLPLPVTHPSRYLLQSIPFLIPGSTLWLHRLWQALLWVGMPLITAWALVRRLQVQPVWLRRLSGLWIFLFLLLAPVYYHLLPCVFLILFGFDKDHPWRSFLFVAIASVWAGISRVNWAPLPGTLAAVLYLLEARPPGSKSPLMLSYLWQPALFAVGGSLIAIGTYALYIVNSGNPVDQFSSSFTSALLWARLWPNAAFPLGILPGVLLVSAPLFAVLWIGLRRKGARIGTWRAIYILTALLIFFAGGLVVSVKIGGGTNLHNMDAYLILLLVFSLSVAFGGYVPATGRATAINKLPFWLLIALLVIPVGFAVFSGEPLQFPSRQEAASDLARIQAEADRALEKGRDVLFISQRHLLTFDLIQNVPLVPEYEKLFLMEMAISHNDAYLSHFDKDIDEQRFSLIVTDPIYINIVDESEDTLAAENNAWVRNVGRPILCAYEPIITFDNPPIELLVPRQTKCNQ